MESAREVSENAPAMRFWELAIADFAGLEVCPKITEVDGEVMWSFFSFESKA